MYKHQNKAAAAIRSGRSFLILSELAAAEKYFESMLDTGITLRETRAEYERISAAAEAKLDALALEDPEEATRIFAASPYFDEYINPANQVYLGRGIIIDRDDLAELDTGEKRAAYILAATGE